MGLLWPGGPGVGMEEDDFSAGGSANASYVGVGNASSVGVDDKT